MKSHSIADSFRASAAALALLLMTGCGPSTSIDSAVLNRASGPEPGTLDPHRARTMQEHNVLRDLFEGLLRYSADGQLIAGAAERWDISADGLTYTLELRPEARWSNGDPVTAEDFVYSFRRLVDPETAAFYAEAIISIRNAAEIVGGEKPPDTLGVEATGRLQLTITLLQPTAYFLSQLAQVATFPVHRKSIDEFGARFERPGNLVGNGAYSLEKWELGLLVGLDRNEHYWNNAATAIDTVRHHVTPESSVELFRYRAGELDFTSTIPAEAFAQLLIDRPDEVHVSAQLGVYYYGLNLHHEELGSKPALRQALSMAIDREELTQRVTGRGEKPAYSWVPPGTDNYAPSKLSFEPMPMSERQVMAKRLYAEAGYSESNPLQIELRYNTSETHRKIAVSIRSMWREVLGFEVTLINEEFRVLVANMQAMKITQIFRSNWNGDFNDAYAFLRIFETDNPFNMFGYRNDEYDSLLQRAALQTDPQKRRALLEAAESVLLADHVVIPIYFQVTDHLVAPKIRGWQDNVLDYHYSQHLSFDQTR